MDDREKRAPEPTLAAAIQAHLREGRLPCADAFAIAQEVGQPPLQVASAAEAVGVRIGWCQLGLFVGEKKGHGPAEAGASPDLAGSTTGPPPPAELHAQIEGALEAGRLPCARAWAIAQHLGLARLVIGQAADTLGVHISRCQLGCFR